MFAAWRLAVLCGFLGCVVGNKPAGVLKVLYLNNFGSEDGSMPKFPAEHAVNTVVKHVNSIGLPFEVEVEFVGECTNYVLQATAIRYATNIMFVMSEGFTQDPVIISNRDYKYNVLFSEFADCPARTDCESNMPYLIRGYNNKDIELNVRLNTMKFFGLNRFFVIWSNAGEYNTLTEQFENVLAAADKKKEIDPIWVPAFNNLRGFDEQYPEKGQDGVFNKKEVEKTLYQARRFGSRMWISLMPHSDDLILVCGMDKYGFYGWGHGVMTLNFGDQGSVTATDDCTLGQMAKVLFGTPQPFKVVYPDPQAKDSFGEVVGDQYKTLSKVEDFAKWRSQNLNLYDSFMNLVWVVKSMLEDDPNFLLDYKPDEASAQSIFKTFITTKYYGIQGETDRNHHNGKVWGLYQLVNMKVDGEYDNCGQISVHDDWFHNLTYRPRTSLLTVTKDFKWCPDAETCSYDEADRFYPATEAEENIEILKDKFVVPNFTYPACGPGFVRGRIVPVIQDNCVQCIPGTRSSDVDNIDCTDCSTGKYANLAGSRMCKLCDPGKYAGVVGMPLCEKCQRGKASEQGSVVCAACQAGRFADSRGLPDCTRCDLATYANASGLHNCFECGAMMTTWPEGAQGEMYGSTTRADCSCREGFYMPCVKKSTLDSESGMNAEDCGIARQLEGEAAGVCTACPQDGFGKTLQREDGGDSRVWMCQGGQAMCETSTWECPNSTSSTPMHRQPVPRKGFMNLKKAPMEGYRCITPENCLGGALPQQGCKGGLVGIACAVCPAGTYEDEPGVCKLCGGGGGVPSFLAWPFLMVVCSGLYYVVNGKQRQKPTNQFLLTCSIGAFVAVMQIFGVFSMFDIEWPSMVGDLMGGMSVVNLDFDSMLNTKCAYQNGIDTQYLMNALLMTAGLVYLILAGLFFPYLPVPQKFRWQRPKVWNTIGAIMQALFTAVAANGVKPMVCYDHPMGDTSIAQFPQILCSMAERQFMASIGICMIGFEVFFYSGSCMAAMMAPKLVSAQGINGQYMLTFRWLIQRFRPDVWWWGCALLPRGLCVSLIPALVPNDSYLQILFALMLLLSYMFACIRFWPWRIPVMNVVDSLSMYLSSFCLLTWVVFLEPLQKDQLDVYESLSLALFGALLFSVVLMFVAIIVAMILFGPDARADEIFILRKPPPVDKLASGLQLAMHVLGEMELPELAKVFNEMLPSDIMIVDEAMRLLQAYGMCVESGGPGGPLCQLDDSDDWQMTKTDTSAAVGENAMQQEEIYV